MFSGFRFVVFFSRCFYGVFFERRVLFSRVVFFGRSILSVRVRWGCLGRIYYSLGSFYWVRLSIRYCWWGK